MPAKRLDFSVPRDLPEMWILRHGQTEWNRDSRLQGKLDSPLTEKGIAQAQAQGQILLAASLPDDAVLVTSPAGRARHTAEIVNAGLGLPLRTDTGLTEINLGAWQGHTPAELAKIHPDLLVEDDPNLWKFRAPGGEMLEDMSRRVCTALARLTGPTVIVTHGVTSRLIRTVALGRAPEALSSLPGGQGVVHHVANGKARVLSL